VEVLCDQNLQALVLEGQPTGKQLMKSWETIITEYTEALGSSEHKYYIQILREVSRLKITLYQIDELVRVLRGTYAKQFADMLNKLLMTKFEFDPTKDDYDKNLDRCLRRSGGIKLSLHLKQIQLEQAEKKLGAKGNSKPDRLYFDNALITLSDHAGFHLTDQIYTSEFCTRLNRYTKFIDSQKSK
jgi:hypothetical protein